MKRVFVSLVLLGIALGCGSSGSATISGECNVGESRPCDCGGSVTGSQTCSDTATFGACMCPVGAVSEAGAPSRVCAEGRSDSGTSKKCQVCDFDVDRSEAMLCPVAPSCANGSLGVPTKAPPRADLDIYIENGKPAVIGDAATPVPPKTAPGTCLDAQLRLRLEKLKINKGGGEGYCIIEANDGITSEAAVTMKTSSLKDAADRPCPNAQRALWGQRQPECTSNNLTLTYYCFKVIDNSAWSAALKALGDTAVQIGGSPAGGQYGWAFGIGGAAANAAAAAVTAASKDENRVRIQQTIPVESLLDLTNGRSWTVRTRVKDGCNLIGCDRDYDWELTVQAWGCAEKLPSPK